MMTFSTVVKFNLAVGQVDLDPIRNMGKREEQEEECIFTSQVEI